MLLRAAMLCVGASLVSGCAMGPAREDPFEPVNRVSYKVHQAVDGTIIKPIAQAYADYTPQPVRLAVRNFFGNIDDMFSVVNDLLQGKGDKAGNDLGRVITNTGFGVLGLIDIAGSAGIPKGNEDFGQTFGFWGIPQGPYLFIPVLGPTTVRDGSGTVIRAYASPVNLIDDIATRAALWSLNFVDLRASALQAENLLNQAALDPYTFIRRSYLQRREYLVYDGKPPPPKEDEE
ncbi:MAG TPA: VacJ family lipoprotein [Casimicrobiaceae bacterium]|nr:VacJ family lipoprotein [Casimicrobiaceae bacterium]